MRRLIRWTAGVMVTQALALAVLAWLLADVEVDGFISSLIGGGVISAVVGAAWPVIYRVATRFHPLFFPLLSFLLTGVAVLGAVPIVNWFEPGGLKIDGFWTAILVALGLTCGSTVLTATFSLNDDQVYDWFVTRPLRRKYGDTPATDVPGVVFLELDGLSEPVLRDAMLRGYMPTLQRWIASGSHQLLEWETDLSSQTSASQAGILLGSNTDIPAFRWWDKNRGKLMESSNMLAAQELERELSTGQGLLADGGGSRWNIFSGDASDCLGTYSRLGEAAGDGRVSYYAYFSNPYSLSRTVGLFLADIVRERYQARRQQLLNIEPRIERSIRYAFIRAATTVVLKEASRFMLIADMFRGIPSVYCTFFAYDEVAHHSGINRDDSLKVLRVLDHTIAHLERSARQAPRPYHLVVLSDHGQSQGATFKQRFGESLGEFVDRLLSSEYQVSSPPPTDEGVTGINSALTEILRNDNRTARLMRRTMHYRFEDGQVDVMREPLLSSAADGAQTNSADVVVLASGNLGLISFTQFSERLSMEQISNYFPGLLGSLQRHEGISFVMVHSEEDGGVVLGADGIYYLDHGYGVGEHPLTHFGPNAAAHLRRTDTFQNAPDILVMSMVNEETGEVAAFEELVGSHGGLGGPQTRPFVLYPAMFEIEPEPPIVGAGHLHQVLRRWLARHEPLTGFEASADEAVKTTAAAQSSERNA